jgi:hypothetical protein
LSRGGLRYGAGRPALHAKASHYLRLDVRVLHRQGLLTAGASFSWEWKSYGEQVGNIGIRVAGNHGVHLDFQRNGTPEHLELRLEHTACQYGGTRPWFNCARCGRRVAIVYLSNSPGCRQCLRLNYPSQSEDAIGRSWGRTAKVMRKLGGEMQDFPRRPNGMRQRTFDRLWAAWLREDDFREDAIAVFMAQHAESFC